MSLHTEKLSLTLNETTILDRVSLRLAPGEMLGLIGPNGAGKSSLLKVIAGLFEADGGDLRLGDQPIDRLSLQQRARAIAYLPQQGELHWPLRVERVVELGRIPHLEPWARLAERDRRVIERVLTETDLQGLRGRRCDTLSGGERARVHLARALASEPRILLADEPVSALDPAHQLDVMQLIRSHCRRGGSAIVVLHDLRLAGHFCDRLLLLHRGRVVASGDAGSVLSAEHLQTAYQIRITPAAEGPFPMNWQRCGGGETSA